MAYWHGNGPTNSLRPLVFLFFSLDWRRTEWLKALSPTIADTKIVELAKTFENVTYMRSSSKVRQLGQK